MSEDPTLLAIDCATLPASVAVVTRGGTAAERVQRDERRTDAWVGIAVPDCLAAAGIAVGDLGAVAVSVGPGTFTGIRVGIATALGLAAPRELPVCGVTTLDALAHIGLRRAPLVAACIDARRGQVYAALYESAAAGHRLPLQALWGPTVCAPEELGMELARHTPPPSVLGSGAALVRHEDRAPEAGDAPVAAESPPLAIAIGELAIAAWKRGDTVPDWPAPSPLYLRPPDAKPPRNPLLAGSS